MVAGAGTKKTSVAVAGNIGGKKMDIIIDCFAGGGGASVGIEMALGRSVDIAINHDGCIR